MAGNQKKNPLLTGPGFSFPLDNFTNGALLVPVPKKDEPTLIPEEIEADSFLGQGPQKTSTFKPVITTIAAVSQTHSNHSSNQSLSSGFSEHTFSPDVPTQDQPVSAPPNNSPILVFTQSLTGFSNPAKPTPVYADALSHQFSQSVNVLPPSSTQFIKPPDPAQSVNPLPPPQTPLSHLFPGQNTSSYNTPSIFTPTPVSSNLSPSIQNSHSSIRDVPSAPPAQAFFDYFSAPGQPNQTFTSSTPPQFENVISPVADPPPISLPPHQSTLPNASSPSGSQVNSYRLGNIKRPVYSRPPELPLAPTAAMPSPMTPAQTSAALFTPCAVDSLGSESVPAETNIGPPPISSFKFSSQNSNQTPPQIQPTVLPPSFANLAQGNTYRPVYHHWFFKKVVEGKVLWQPFSMNDSLALEQAFTSATISPDTKVGTDGGRYDVEVLRRRRLAVYWEEEPTEVRRCSWFFKGSMDIRYLPYEENVATMLEEEYRIASTTNEWNRHVPLPDGEVIVIHSPNAIAHHTRSPSPDVWGNSPQMQQKPRVVKRGMDEFDIGDGEPEKVDHLLFLVHGIGQFCDLKFRPVTEVVDDFRNISLQLLQSHFKEAVESGQVGRVEVLPISWHQALHNEHIDQRLKNITLQSIPRLRHFTNDTLLDILFYTSPVFCETIVQAVGSELNRLYNLFLSRNPGYQGGVSLGGHSLGSLILFDMLCNQTPISSPSPSVNTAQSSPTSDAQELNGEEDEEVQSLGCMKAHKARLSRRVSYVTMGKAGTGLPFISYPQLIFRPKAFFALGSPIGMFVTVRGIESLGEEFCLPTCSMFFNIFHPFDPVAYRVESLIKPEYSNYSPLLIPHHKGRKRMHLELKDTLEHMGTALKQRLVESVRNTWNTVYQLAMFHRSDEQTIEQEMNKVIENEIMQSCSNGTEGNQTPDNNPVPDIQMGKLNSGRRIDYVLQEAPLESFNEYLFALSSHVCYWESEDTMLMILKEIYNTMGVTPDSQVVHQILPFDVADGGGESSPHYVPLAPISSEVGMDPTAPISDNINIGPPPKLGFYRK